MNFFLSVLGDLVGFDKTGDETLEKKRSGKSGDVRLPQGHALIVVEDMKMRVLSRVCLCVCLAFSL